MKIIIVGATGFVGKEVVVQSIENSRISSIIVVTRRCIGKSLSQNPKVQVILHEDFHAYPADLLEQLLGAQGCVWCLGGKVEDFPDLETAKKVGVDFTLAALRERDMSKFATGTEIPLRLLQCQWGRVGSGQETLGILRYPKIEARQFINAKTKGVAERRLLDIAEDSRDVFQAIVLRPGGVVPDGSVLLGKIASLMTPVVPLSQLAKALVESCINPPSEKVIENREILQLGS
ncbi:uncharacterized protein Z519_10177 [Cladophialophora bantiana CBS 173.52]|uniref:NAD(P)-binding domain-containing protein n=1 Tax=Cladophialophora bantiana (strain ATCC 10958 / CBS 173.52 / CDC B-1940 / NIH 8579) TaxID=1442370 RepID=A0A0D2H7N8_CLAB1|nr:uncharacterized protein Z519_10177 [Cladophialophora bantiana CBS 173.52]KIW89323.1 hypothetical protein Z519_10177 [Cladophialophora bantiana CBS 173.52]